VAIRSANEVLYQGTARAISSYSDKGIFDVLPLHTHFISIIKKKIVVLMQDGSKKEYAIDTGIIQAKNNIVEIFLGFEPINI
ncbi:MAG: hypothetical protein ACE5DQ_01195, partial [Candidatus Paceibacterota bacterium]